MALRDPGAPRRNPLFAVDDAAGPNAAGPDAAGHDEPAGDDGWDDWADDPIFGGPGSHGPDNPLFGAPGSAVGPFISALTEAGPEAAEHLVTAAHELTLAIKVVVDAFERILRGGGTGECWFVQPGRTSEAFRFRNVPGPRTADGESHPLPN